MRGLKSTIALVVVLGGLVGYIYFVDRNRPASSEPAKKEPVFADVKAEDIEEIQITSAEGETSRLEKSNGTWQIVEPVKATADETEVSSLASSLATLDVQRVLEEKASDLKPYGLEPARIAVGFRTKGQKELRRVAFGEKTPTGGDLYARRLDAPRVFLVSSFVDATFNKGTFALRDKKILAFDRMKADGLELTADGTTLQFAKSGDEWKMVKPLTARADYGAVEGAIERLGSAQMQSLTADGATDLAPYGLDKPVATMTVLLGSSRATLLLGRTENAVVFAKDASRPMIFTVAPTIRTDVIKEAGEYRRKDLFDMRSFTATRVEVRRGAETMTFEKTKGKDGKDVWRNAAGKDVDAAKVEELLTTLSTVRASSFDAAADPALAMPTLTVTARFDNRTETVTFGGTPGALVAARADEPGTARLDGTALDGPTKALDALK